MIADSSMENIFRELREATASREELAACLRVAVAALNQLGDTVYGSTMDIYHLVLRCEKALKEYDK